MVNHSGIFWRGVTMACGFFVAFATTSDNPVHAADLRGNWTLNFNPGNTSDPHAATPWIFEGDNAFSTTAESGEVDDIDYVLFFSFGNKVIGIPITIVYPDGVLPLPVGIISGEAGTSGGPATSIEFIAFLVNINEGSVVVGRFDGTKDP